MSKTGLIFSIVQSIHKEQAQEEKRQILLKYQKEATFKRILEVCYNPWINLKMEDFVPKYLGKDFGMGISRFLHIVDDIIAKKLNQKEADFAARMAFMHINKTEAPVLLQILNGTLADYMGLEIDTINSVFDNLIMDYPLREIKENTIENYQNFPASIQPLIRGLRTNIIVHDKSVQYKGKNGNDFDFSIHNDQFLTLAQGQGTVFDGHAVLVDDSNNIISVAEDEILDADPKDVRFLIWDAIRYDGFIAGKDTRIGYNWRYNGIEHMILLALDKVENPVYDVVKAELVGSQEQLEQSVTKFKDGCVIKQLDGTWSQGVTDQEFIYFPQSS